MEIGFNVLVCSVLYLFFNYYYDVEQCFFNKNKQSYNSVVFIFIINILITSFILILNHLKLMFCVKFDVFL